MRIIPSILLLLQLITNSLVAQDESFPNSWSHDLDTKRRLSSKTDIDTETIKIRRPLSLYRYGYSQIENKFLPPFQFTSRTLSFTPPINGGPTPLEDRDRYKRKDVLGSLINRTSMIIQGRLISKTEQKIDETIHIEATIAIIKILKGSTADKEIKVSWTEVSTTDLPPPPDLRTPDQKSRQSSRQISKPSHSPVDKGYVTADGIWFIIKPTESKALRQSVEWLPSEIHESVSELIKNSKP